MTELDVFTDAELAAQWKCDIRLVQKMLREGRLQGFKVGRDWRIARSSVDSYMHLNHSARLE
jgi:excisionase family DNA binding protein